MEIKLITSKAHQLRIDIDHYTRVWFGDGLKMYLSFAALGGGKESMLVEFIRRDVMATTSELISTYE